ncbi:MAG TPA: tRNA pseudouridine(38-40) synthase TruA [Chromatiales bacterium]|nr:tRNA pseudouridine(38-40) synthase TruA [Thiotrichales bacterium]HIP67387.1 tRNA pseudouridine(38-40) synthase TruA [Chromatiales bacterium]
MRIAAGIEYDGDGFCGWQRSPNVRSVQAELEKALSKVADHAVCCVCAGRTDSGVHAQQQIIHFDSEAKRPDHAWLLGGNSALPKDISIRWVTAVNEGFHARFKAEARSYRYVIINQLVRPAILAGKVTWVRKPLQVDAMQQAAQYLVGEHDFSSFRAAACEANTPVRHVMLAEVTRAENFIYLDIKANAFLHHMVRNIAGVLISIGQGDHSPEWTQQLLQKRDRTQGGVTAPPDGLYLVSAHYPEKWGIPRSPRPIVFG